MYGDSRDFFLRILAYLIIWSPISSIRGYTYVHVYTGSEGGPGLRVEHKMEKKQKKEFDLLDIKYKARRAFEALCTSFMCVYVCVCV